MQFFCSKIEEQIFVVGIASSIPVVTLPSVYAGPVRMAPRPLALPAPGHRHRRFP